jgi:hypothetical protein
VNCFPIRHGVVYICNTGAVCFFMQEIISSSLQISNLIHRTETTSVVTIIETIVPLGTQVVYEFFPLLSISCPEPQFIPASTHFFDDRSSAASLRSSSLPASLSVPQ